MKETSGEKKDPQEKDIEHPTRFQLGNERWKNRLRDGREKIYTDPEEAKKIAIEYFNHIDTTLFQTEVASAGKVITTKGREAYTVIGLCNFMGIGKSTFKRYEKGEEYAEFWDVFTCMRAIAEEDQLSGALSGRLNANLVARLHGYADKKEVDVTDERKSVASVFPTAKELAEAAKNKEDKDLDTE